LAVRMVSADWCILTLKTTSAQDLETSVPANSSSQDSFHPDDDQIPSRFVTPGFKPFPILPLSTCLIPNFTISFITQVFISLDSIAAWRNLSSSCTEKSEGLNQRVLPFEMPEAVPFVSPLAGRSLLKGSFLNKSSPSNGSAGKGSAKDTVL